MPRLRMNYNHHRHKIRCYLGTVYAELLCHTQWRRLVPKAPFLFIVLLLRPSSVLAESRKDDALLIYH